MGKGRVVRWWATYRMPAGFAVATFVILYEIFVGHDATIASSGFGLLGLLMFGPQQKAT